MITQVPFALTLTVAEHRLLVQSKPWNGEQWSKAPDEIRAIKAKIRNQLSAVQDRCAYCGLRFKGIADAQIEHIAAKAHYRYPQFTFTLRNLVLGCGYCNNLQIKGTKNTIAAPVNIQYSKCTFLLVHPYSDDPDDHYEWTDQVDKILIQVKDDSSKGAFSISMFTLDSAEMSELRAAQVRMDEIKRGNPINAQDEKLVQAANNYKP